MDSNCAWLRLRYTGQSKDSRSLEVVSDLFMQDILFSPLVEVHWLYAVLGLPQDEVHGHGLCQGPNMVIISFLLDITGKEH